MVLKVTGWRRTKELWSPEHETDIENSKFHNLFMKMHNILIVC